MLIKMWGSGSSITFRVRAFGPTDEGPDLDFVEPQDLGMAVIALSTTAGALLRGPVTEDFGDPVQVLVELTKGAHPCAASAKADFSGKE